MKREIRVTEDGSHTLYVPELDESYHSIHGAIQESHHVFLLHGLLTLDKESLNILEIGFGTGLNALLTLAEAQKRGIKINYHTVEKYPLDKEEYSCINFEELIEGISPGKLHKLHDASWGEAVTITENFTLTKELSDFRSMNPYGPFDLVYFDAFAPQKQAHLWSEEIFKKISGAVKPGGVLVTYTSMGSVRRVLTACDFDVNKIPGPPGKRHMIRASRR
ncbi:MAG: tRNA (5-methylaminomethyl-2-thiouridine)(34)-methyltransferase MnmD [Bacteroidetes bacterium]|nr:tRNA (5-methylaminomethyl-2-thiouridine)(34)-methyltransferase MnmD [Bacteroidota bacterium]